jgi:hypothetical protein
VLTLVAEPPFEEGACQAGRAAGNDRRRYAPGMSIDCRGVPFKKQGTTPAVLMTDRPST